jgi:putative addiction module component (TIGR02574 family)
MMIANIRTLPIGEKIRLVEDIWDSIAADQAALPMTDEQRSELDRRLDAYESDGVKGREAGAAIADIKKRL